MSGNIPCLPRPARATHTITRHVRDLIASGIVKGDADTIGHALWAAAHGVVVLHLAGRLPEGVDARTLYLETMRLTFRGARTPASGRNRKPRLKLASKR